MADKAIEATKTDEDVESRIKAVLEERIRPALAAHGGDVSFEGFEDGIVYLTLKGMCVGCPGATATLKMGIERALREQVPEVKEVRRAG